MLNRENLTKSEGFLSRNVTHLRSRVARLVPNYREHEKILLAMPLDFDKSGRHEVCSRIRRRLYCLYIAKLRGVATALSGKAGATV